MEIHIVRNATLAPKLIRSSAFRTVSVAEVYRQIAAKTGLDFNATIELLKYFGTFIDGDHHKKIREIMAKRVAASSRLQVERLQKELTRIFQTIVRPPNEVELVSQIVKPLWRVIASAIWPVEESAIELAYEIDMLFCPTLPLRERLELNERIDRFRSKDGFKEEDLIHLCLAALGARTFVGAITLSLYETVSKHPDVRSSAIAWPNTIPSSALSFVDRICVENTKMGQLKFRVGDRVRIFTKDMAFSEDEKARLCFGVGAHSCLGRPISETAWRLLAAQLADSDVVLVPIKLQMSEHNEPFSIPIEASVSIRA
jgi:hypothetical protein